MNLYFLVEGVTERKLYPKWLEYLLPSLRRISSPGEANGNSYFLISGGGFPSLLDNHLISSVQDINDSGNYDYFVISLDSDEINVPDKVKEVKDRIEDKDIDTGSCELKIIVQNRCIETWLLGNRSVFSRNPTESELISCIRFYNVFKNDPELMLKPSGYDESISIFHYEYLRLMLAERNIRYSKKHPKDAARPYYLRQLQTRLAKTPFHLASLNYFFDFCAKIAE